MSHVVGHLVNGHFEELRNQFSANQRYQMPRRCPYLLPLKYEVHLRRLFSLGSREMDSTAKCFGVIADIQHADVDDGTDFR